MASPPLNKNDPAYDANQFFLRKEFEKALEAYSKAIEENPNVANLFSKRASTYFYLNRPYDALMDTEAGLKIEPNYAKMIHNKCWILTQMRRFHEADQFLNDALKRMGDVPNEYENKFKKLVDDMNRLKSEFVEGRYDIPAMVEESKTSSKLVKHADYYAWNKFEIREIGGIRGLVAKERIELGELLIACKAIAFVPLSKANAFDVMIEKIRKKLLHRPDLAKEFFRLYAAPQLGHLENWTEGDPMDLERIKGVIQYNYYGDRQVLFDGTMEADAQHACVALVPSFINHACVNFNCARYFVGDFTFIRASRPIEKGEELVISYFPPGLPFEKRQYHCKLDGFECQCLLCQLEGQEDSIEFKNRLEEMEQFLSLFYHHISATRVPDPCYVRTLERFVEELPVHRPELSTDFLAFKIRKAIATSFGFSDPKASIPMWKELIEDLKSAGDFLEALFLTKALKKAAVDSGSQKEQDKCDKLARGIAKMFFGDERVADLKE